MPVTAVVGANWGDEGKGKMIDYMAARADVVVRFQGGANAGHTVITPFGKFVTHLLPSGVFHPNVTNIIGPGVALDVAALVKEYNALQAAGVPKPRVIVSDRAQLVLPVHRILDQYEEERLGDNKFGSTQTGIAPFYADKYFKVGISAADLRDPDRLLTAIEKNIEKKNILFEHLYHRTGFSARDLCDELLGHAPEILPLLADTSTLLHQAIEQNQAILLEGQLGALKDPDHGIYPFVTSSSPLAGHASVGAGIPPWAIKRIVAVTKAYATCVGAGPLVTEIFGREADILRERGGDKGEFGATTGRPRRVGWFDAVATWYGCRIQGATEVVLSMLDVIEYLDAIPVCTAYLLDGRKINHFPIPALLDRVSPVWEMLPGWRKDIRHIREFSDLPENARNYVKQIERLIETPIRWLSVGPQRDAVISVQQ